MKSLIAIAIVLVACGSSTSSSSVSTISLSPNPCGVARANNTHMSAEATFPDGTKQDITAGTETQWSSANTNTATVNPMGILVGVNAGVTSITATFRGATGSVNCTISP